MNSVELLAKTGEAAKSGPIGLAVILLLCIACYFLFKSMSKHLRIVRERFPPAPPETPRTAEPAESAPPADQPPADRPPDESATDS